MSNSNNVEINDERMSNKLIHYHGIKAENVSTGLRALKEVCQEIRDNVEFANTVRARQLLSAMKRIDSRTPDWDNLNSYDKGYIFEMVVALSAISERTGMEFEVAIEHTFSRAIDQDNPLGF